MVLSMYNAHLIELYRLQGFMVHETVKPRYDSSLLASPP